MAIIRAAFAYRRVTRSEREMEECDESRSRFHSVARIFQEIFVKCDITFQGDNPIILSRFFLPRRESRSFRGTNRT